MWLYQVLDITATLTESLGLYLFSICFCKEPRYRASVNRWLITGISFLCAYTLTWFSELGALKAPFLLTIYLVLLKVCYRDSVYLCAVAEELNYIATTMLSESIGMLIAHWIYQDQMFVLVDGISLLRWEIYVITLSIRIVSFFVIYIICRKFRYRISPKDFLPLTGIFVVAFLPFVFNAFQHLNMNKAGDSVLYVFITVMPFIFITIFLYVKNIIYLREQEQQDKIQIAQLQQQYAYYQDKMKDEERVRSIYHDLKNHLLVMESRQNTAETRQMAETLRSQIADYEDYVHTGNEFLDIILKDKAAKAREKQIDFSAMVDFNGIDFMEPLDISTIFGNAIDNAMEASEPLPEDRRLITVKAERVRDMLIITVENNTLQGTQPAEETTKKDRFVHGFGIPNIKKAVEKYDGQCSFRQEDGTYLLKILIPIP